eukprot:CAMPEP_0202864510 /NCGR_PEP_ID=MMETSP1391-20130828/4718_1 /ASSEMBLY_ACC=CAM_ASM_000867 /TAXON_ID=1034604 /ORGANISM="Chlamydomonas leiostraca, Strain SAG 11-49" /LENGTH=1008 /DNA_ID=CAMNT_0049544257 /DNA_START=178 /DNA_END=3205 /DNA_ORIENTATION=-
MGNALVCFEHGHWDPHPEICQPYPALPQSSEPKDMAHPLSCYFISSGHNSYLTGNQFNSDSGTKTITQCLLKGCRVIELDCYNKQPGFQDPVCKHGGTLTKPVSFRACVNAVRASAFSTSPYPVVITLELHADEANQRDMADVIAHELGPALYVPQPGEPGEGWKSPHDLQHKVLIRANAPKCCDELRRLVYITNTKFTNLHAANASAMVTSCSVGESKIGKLAAKVYEASGLFLQSAAEEVLDIPSPLAKAFTSSNTNSPWGSNKARQGSRQNQSGSWPPDTTSPRSRQGAMSSPQQPGSRTSDNGGWGSSGGGAPTSRRAQARMQHKAKSMQPSRREMARASLAERPHHAHPHHGLVRGRHKRSNSHHGVFRHSRQQQEEELQEQYWEQELEQEQEEDEMIDEAVDGDGQSAPAGPATLKDMFRYTARNLLRVYPKGTRLDSSNYDPMEAWALGTSFAALNWQTWDKALWINEAMFSRNAGCGYVLKPSWMLPGIPNVPEPSFPSLGERSGRTASGSPSGANPLPARAVSTLKVHLYSAFADQRGGCMCLRDDLFIQLELKGMPEDNVKVYSHTANNTGRLLIDQTYEVRIKYPEMAVLLLLLKDDDMPTAAARGDTLGYWSVPVSELVPGSYQLNLRDPSTGNLRTDRWAKVSFEWGESAAVGGGDSLKVGPPSKHDQALPAESFKSDGSLLAVQATGGSGTAGGVRASHQRGRQRMGSGGGAGSAGGAGSPPPGGYADGQQREYSPGAAGAYAPHQQQHPEAFPPNRHRSSSPPPQHYNPQQSSQQRQPLPAAHQGHDRRSRPSHSGGGSMVAGAAPGRQRSPSPGYSGRRTPSRSPPPQHSPRDGYRSPRQSPRQSYNQLPPHRDGYGQQPEQYGGGGRYGDSGQRGWQQPPQQQRPRQQEREWDGYGDGEGRGRSKQPGAGRRSPSQLSPSTSRERRGPSPGPARDQPPVTPNPLASHALSHASPDASPAVSPPEQQGGPPGRTSTTGTPGSGGRARKRMGS